MRYREINENIQLVKVTPPFVRAVRQMADNIASDIAEDLPQDDKGLAAVIVQLLHKIETGEPISSVMTIMRAELRPRPETAEDITSVGCHWSWSENGAKVYHNQNASEYHDTSEDDLVNVIIVAEVPFAAIDWVFTIATNLILPSEAEITVRTGSMIALSELYFDDGYLDCKGRKVSVDGQYDDF